MVRLETGWASRGSKTRSVLGGLQLLAGHAHREVGGGSPQLVRRVTPVNAEEGAVEEGVVVVARRSPNGVGAAGRRVERPAGAVADRGDVQVVGAGVQVHGAAGGAENVDQRLDHQEAKAILAGKVQLALAEVNRHLPDGQQGPTAAGHDTLPDFPAAAGRVKAQQVVGKDAEYFRATAANVEVVVNLGLRND